MVGFHSFSEHYVQNGMKKSVENENQVNSIFLAIKNHYKNASAKYLGLNISSFCSIVCTQMLSGFLLFEQQIKASTIQAYNSTEI